MLVGVAAGRACFALIELFAAAMPSCQVEYSSSSAEPYFSLVVAMPLLKLLRHSNSTSACVRVTRNGSLWHVKPYASRTGKPILQRSSKHYAAVDAVEIRLNKLIDSNTFFQIDITSPQNPETNQAIWHRRYIFTRQHPRRSRQHFRSCLKQHFEVLPRGVACAQ